MIEECKKIFPFENKKEKEIRCQKKQMPEESLENRPKCG